MTSKTKEKVAKDDDIFEITNFNALLRIFPTGRFKRTELEQMRNLALSGALTGFDAESISLGRLFNLRAIMPVTETAPEWDVIPKGMRESINDLFEGKTAKERKEIIKDLLEHNHYKHFPLFKAPEDANAFGRLATELLTSCDDIALALEMDLSGVYFQELKDFYLNYTGAVYEEIEELLLYRMNRNNESEDVRLKAAELYAQLLWTPERCAYMARAIYSENMYVGNAMKKIFLHALFANTGKLLLSSRSPV